MSSTNKTTNLKLSQFIGSDKPQWLVDYNSDMSKIDTGVAAVKAQADATDLTVASHTSSIANLTQASSDQASAITALRTDTDGNTGSINTINSLIGNGEPTTTDKTLIGAINELKEDIDEIAPSGGVEADDVAYDNNTSGLTATNVQAAIDELAQGGSATVEADDVTYDNTSSGLTATNAQAAIDEIAGKAIKTDTASGTTSASGHLSTSVTTSQRIILAAYGTQGGSSAIVVPYVSVADNTWVFDVKDPNGTAAASKAAVVTYTYIDA